MLILCSSQRTPHDCPEHKSETRHPPLHFTPVSRLFSPSYRMWPLRIPSVCYAREGSEMSAVAGRCGASESAQEELLYECSNVGFAAKRAVCNYMLLCCSHRLAGRVKCHSHPYGPRTLPSTPLDPAARAVAFAYGRTVSINIHTCYDGV